MSSTKKFIPNGDLDFSEMAQRFAAALSRDPRKYGVAVDDAAAVSEAVEHFRGALREARGGHLRRGVRSASRVLTLRKDEARKEAEKLIRRVAGAVRSNDRITAADKALLGIAPRKKAGEGARGAERDAAGAGGALTESPSLSFVRALHRAAHVPEHELRFYGRSGAGRPRGAVRLELFVELVPPDDRVPERPGGSGYGCHYLRSYVKSPVVLTPPLAERPMRVVYWGRWADSSGGVGPMSRAAAGWVEGGSHHLMGLSVGDGQAEPRRVEAERLAREAARLPRLSAVAGAESSCDAVTVDSAVRVCLPVGDGRAAA